VQRMKDSGSGQPTRGNPPAWGLCEGVRTPRRVKKSLLRNFTHGSGSGWIPWRDLNERK
jgi:hypothetical protein